MALMKVAADDRTRAEILSIISIFRAKVIDAGPRSFVIEVTGDEGKINSFLELLSPMGIKEIVRSGRIAIGRGNKSLTTN